MGSQPNDVFGTPPIGGQLTADDRERAKIYLRLLDAEAAGASWQEAVAALFARDPAADPERLEHWHAAHLARAKWIRDGGYLRFLAQPRT